MKQSMFKTKHDKTVDNFQRDGFIILKGAISNTSIKMIQRDLSRLASQYANKLSLRISDSQTVPEIFSAIEDADKKKFYEMSLIVGDIASMNNITFNEDYGDKFNEILLSYNVPLVATHSGIFFNKKKVTRLQYKWHQERSYFFNHDLGCHIWYPIFNNISTTGGPMLIKKGSHKQHFEYDAWSEDNGLSQLEIESNLLTNFETYKCENNVGDLVIFDHHSVHCTEPVTKTSIARIAGIRRFVGNSFGLPIACSKSNTTSEEKTMSSVIKASKTGTLLKQ